MGRVFVISAPSGTGKTSVVSRVLKSVPRVERVITATTRPKREGEVEGKDYYFLKEEDFKEKIKRGEFLEFAQIYGYYYGTLKKEVERITSEGRDALLVIDVQGALQVRKKLKGVITVFLLPPSLEELRKRLLRRGEREVEKRLEVAKEELRYAKEYDFVLVNRFLDDTVEKLSAIIISQRCKFEEAVREVDESLKRFLEG